MFAVASMPTWRSLLATSAAVGAFSLMLLAPPSYAQTASVPTNPSAESAPQVNADTTSCKELKSRLQNSGALNIVSGPRGWGDTYYARVPQCQFWQRPLFSYVITNDGWCGVGHICAVKITGN